MALRKWAIFQKSHRDWADEAIKDEMVARESRWSEAVAVGSLSFVNTVKSELGFKAAHREVIEQGETYVLREESETYRLFRLTRNPPSSLVGDGGRFEYSVI